MKDSFRKFQNSLNTKLTLINLMFALCCIATYEATMYAIVYWTNWTDSSGAYGGILDYRFMGVSTIFHVTSQNVLGQALFAFPDITAYLLVVMIILNLLAIRADMQKPGIPTIATANIVLDVFCILAYSWATMQFIAELLNRSGSTPGGILNYSPTLGFAGYHVTSGHLESMGTGFGLDLTLWMLLAIVALNAIKAKSDRRRQTR